MAASYPQPRSSSSSSSSRYEDRLEHRHLLEDPTIAGVGLPINTQEQRSFAHGGGGEEGDGGGSGSGSESGRGTIIYRVFPRRFWVLFVLSMASLLQSCVWMTYSPISAEVQQLYGWSTFNINLLVAWGPIIYVPLVFVLPAIVDKIGLRASVTLGTALTCSGTILRCITTADPYALWLANLAQILNAAAGPFVLATPSKLSDAWFEPNHRTTATAIATMANYMGSAVGFLIALPIITTRDVQWCLYAEAIAGMVMFGVASLDHCWPELPSVPPSVSSHVGLLSPARQDRIGRAEMHGRPVPEGGLEHACDSLHFPRIPLLQVAADRVTNLWVDIGTLLRNKDFMILTVVYGVTGGTASGFSGILNLILSPLGYSQSDASWLGFVATITSIVGGVGMGLIADYFKNVKLLLLLLFLCATITISWFSLLANGILSSTLVSLFISCSLGNLFINATTALFYESSVEVCFPIGAVASNAVLTSSFNAAGACYMLADAYISASAMNWLLTGCCAGGGLLLLFYTERTTRAELDAKGEAFLA